MTRAGERAAAAREALVQEKARVAELEGHDAERAAERAGFQADIKKLTVSERCSARPLKHRW